MLEVKIGKILPVTEARDSFNKLVDEVEGSDELYVLTKNGKPAAVVVGVHHLEKLTGTSQDELMEKADEAEASAPADIAAIDNAVPAEESETVSNVTEDLPATPATAQAVEATPAPEQSSSVTSNPFGNETPAAPTGDVTTTPATTGVAADDDPLDFLNDNDADLTPPSAPAEEVATPVAPIPATEPPAPSTNGYAPATPPPTSTFGAPAPVQPIDNSAGTPPQTPPAGL